MCLLKAIKAQKNNGGGLILLILLLSLLVPVIATKVLYLRAGNPVVHLSKSRVSDLSGYWLHSGKAFHLTDLKGKMSLIVLADSLETVSAEMKERLRELSTKFIKEAVNDGAINTIIISKTATKVERWQTLVSESPLALVGEQGPCDQARLIIVDKHLLKRRDLLLTSRGELEDLYPLFAEVASSHHQKKTVWGSFIKYIRH